MTAPATDVCILGYGKVARELHAPAWMRLESQGLARVVAIAERSESAARTAAFDFPQATVTHDALAALKATSAQLIDICTPGPTHPRLVLQALGQGHSVLAEKPVCYTPDELSEIIRIQAGLKLSIYQTLRLSDPMRRFRGAFDRGSLGQVTSVSIRHHGRHVLNELEWVTASRGDGILFESGIHFIDLAHDLLQQRTSALSIDHVAFVTLPHRQVMTSFQLAGHTGARRIFIDFSQDTLEHSSIHTDVLVCATGADAELRFYPPGFRLMSGLQDPIQEIVGQAHRLSDFVAATIARRQRSKAHELIMRDLITCLDTGQDTMIPATSLRGTVATLDLVAQAWARPPVTPSGERGRAT